MKIRVGIIFGGKSAEHEVSVISAQNVINAIDKNKYEVIPVYINPAGKWLVLPHENKKISEGSEKYRIEPKEFKEQIVTTNINGETQLIPLFSDKNVAQYIDVFFPVLHGTYGEDGTIQGLFKMSGIPFVGCGVLASSITMDKEMTKRLLRDAGIAIADFFVLKRNEDVDYSKLESKLGYPMFVKPANLGSSVGVHKAKDEKQLKEAINDAFRYDNKVIVEEAITGREIECAILGNEDPRASLPGEVIPMHEFYSYEAKYIDEKGAELRIPAPLSSEKIKEVQEMAIKSFRTLECEGMARVDMFLQEDGKLLVNELNTIPGFTNISMYPKLWEITGIKYPDLIDQLIQLAIKREERDSKLKTTNE